MAIVSALKIERTEKNISQATLERLSGVKQQRLSMIENGLRAKPDEIKRISDALGVEPNHLFFRGTVKTYEVKKEDCHLVGYNHHHVSV